MNITQAFPSLGFIGAGNMAGAILRAVAGKGLIPPGSCAALDAIPGKAAELASELGIRDAGDLSALMNGCSSIVLATKPQDLRKVLHAMQPLTRPDHRIISIAAGIACSTIEEILPKGTRVVRVMPNTPALIGEGAAGIAPGSCATSDDVEAVRALFEAVGVAVIVEESLLDAVTALSGSGPAYVFRFMELIQSAGEEMGLSPELARQMTLQTFLGASKLAIQSPESLAELRRRVTSPGGTTAAALEVFEKLGLEKLIKDGLIRARDRSIELSRK